MKKKIDGSGNVLNAKEVIEALEAKLQVAVGGLQDACEALEFYGDEKSQIPPEYFNTGRPQADFTTPYRMDKGKIAREALEKIKETK